MALQGSQKLAVLLCKFTDTASDEPHDRAFYEDLFVNRGTGGLNDYWIAASLDHINLDGTQVFGWKTFDTDRDTFVANHPGRWDKIKGAIDQFPELDPSGFVMTVALFNTSVNDGGAQGGVLGQAGDANVTFLAHEVGHILGLEHSFDLSDRVAVPDWPSAKGEYFDRHDIMSAMGVDSDAGHRFSPRGPMLNTPNLDRMGWLPASRVWHANTNSSDIYELDLVALEYPEIGGYLAARTGGWMAEFRIPDRFDAGLNQPAVLFHNPTADPNSYIIASNPSAFVHDWLPGQELGHDDLFEEYGGVWVTVMGFDLNRKTARLRVQIKAVRPPFVGLDEIHGLGIGQLPHDGMILVVRNGRIVPIPVPEPEYALADLRSQLRTLLIDVVREDLDGIVTDVLATRAQVESSE